VKRLTTLSLRVPVLLVWFVVLWESLWGNFTFANLFSGVVVSIGLVLLVRLPDADLRSYRGGRVRPVRAAIFLVYFVVKVVQANVALAWEVVTPRNTIEPGILGIPIRDCSDALVTLIANAFTLTPGSLTIEVLEDPTVIYVHVLHLNDPERVRADLFRLAEMAVKAFGTTEALAQFRPSPTTEATS
jgi:multicomponent Na+:H+ antiporter subunit E